MIGLSIMAFFIVERGWTAVAFAAAGVALRSSTMRHRCR